MIAETERLVLRPFDLLDGDDMFQVFADPEVMRFSSGVKSREWVDEWIRTRLKHYETWGFGLWAVVVKGESAVIGYAGLTYFPDIAGSPEKEIGYRLIQRYWGKGYATEAAMAARDYGFEVLGLGRLIALIDPQNVASRRVAEKIGMYLEKEVMLGDYDHPDYVYVAERSTSSDNQAEHSIPRGCRLSP